MSSSFDPDQAQHFFGLDLGFSRLQKLSTDDTIPRVATVREKVLENEKFSRSGKSQGITFSVREI